MDFSLSEGEKPMSLLRGCLSALLIFTFISPTHKAVAAEGVVTSNGRAIPEDNLAYPVLLTLTTRLAKALASGFFLNTPHATYLVTANHFLAELDVLLRDPTTHEYISDDIITATSYSRDPADNKRNSFILNLHTLQSDHHLQADAIADILVITIGTGTTLPPNQAPMTTPVAGVTVQEMTALGVVGVDIEGVKTFSQVLIGNDVIMYGYPTSLGLATIPQINPDRPLLRKGIVAGKNVQQHTLILDCPTYQGNSGGPVFEVDRDLMQMKFWLIGVAEQFVPYQTGGPTINMVYNSGYAIASPMDAVLKMVDAAEKPSSK